MPEISVIVPVYKVEKYIHRCVDSILTQTFTDFELILVDDGSPDNCGAICDEYAAKDDRIRVIHQENGGVSKARNVGLDVAEGEYIAFCDSDDFLENDYLEKISEHKSDLVICGTIVVDETETVIETRSFTDREYNTRDEIDFGTIYREFAAYSPYGKLFRNKILKEAHICFPEGISWGEDGMFVADYLCQINSLRVLSYSGYYYVKYYTEIRLSSAVSANMADIIMESRHYCISRMEKSSPKYAVAVCEICKNDIVQNCKALLCNVLCSEKMPTREKKLLLEQFMCNPYIMDVVRNADKYYLGFKEMAIWLKAGTPKGIVKSRNSWMRIQTIKQTVHRILKG